MIKIVRYTEMPQFSFNYSVFEGDIPIYAVGDRELILQSVEKSFMNSGFTIHKKKNRGFTHFPGGWADRAASAYVQLSVQNGAMVNRFSMAYEFTSNPFVTLLSVNYYFKKNLLRPNRRHDELPRFLQAAFQEFTRCQIPLISPPEWDRFLADFPQFICAPGHASQPGEASAFPPPLPSKPPPLPRAHRSC